MKVTLLSQKALYYNCALTWLIPSSWSISDKQDCDLHMPEAGALLVGEAAPPAIDITEVDLARTEPGRPRPGSMSPWVNH